MLFIVYLAISLLVVYIDSVACLAVEHNFNWKVSLISALVWPISCIVVIYKVTEHQKDKS
jgi:hypothetical protein